MGIRASSTCELQFDNLRVTPDMMLGEEGKGYKIAIEGLNEGRIGIGAQVRGAFCLAIFFCSFCRPASCRSGGND